MDKLAINFGIIFGVIGFLISLVFSFFSKNPLFAIATNVLISTLISIVVGVVVFFILKQKVPEILEIFEGDLSSRNANYGEGEIDETFAYSDDSFETSDSLNMSNVEQTSIDEASSPKVNTTEEKTKHFGDHIVVDKITIKNEPKLMAEAIRTMLSREE